MRGGKKHLRVFCQAMKRDGSRKCYAKGFLMANGKMLCRFHGFHNVDGMKRPNYTLQSKRNQLKSLKQFKDKSDEEIETYIKEVLDPRLKRGPSKYNLRQAASGKHPNRNFRGKNITDQLKGFLQDLQKKS